MSFRHDLQFAVSSQLGREVAQVGSDGDVLDSKPGAYVSTGRALGQQGQDLVFALCQPAARFVAELPPAEHRSDDFRPDQGLAGDRRANCGDQISAAFGRADEGARLRFNGSEQHRVGLRLRQRNHGCRPAGASQVDGRPRYRAHIHAKVDDDDVRPSGWHHQLRNVTVVEIADDGHVGLMVQQGGQGVADQPLATDYRDLDRSARQALSAVDSNRIAYNQDVHGRNLETKSIQYNW